jgi:hypothetical protein
VWAALVDSVALAALLDEELLSLGDQLSRHVVVIFWVTGNLSLISRVSSRTYRFVTSFQ